MVLLMKPNNAKRTTKPHKFPSFLVCDDGVFVRDFSGLKRFVHPWLDVQIWPYMDIFLAGFSSFPVIHYYLKGDSGSTVEYRSAFNSDSPKRIAQVLTWARQDAGFDVSDYQKKRLSEFIAYQLQKRTSLNKEAFIARGYPVVFNTF